MIELEKPFKVFVLTPYCPISDTVAGYDFRQIIIKCQYETKKMMFKTITKFINKMKKIFAEDEEKMNYFNKIRADDYLVFLSLVKVIQLDEKNYKKKYTENALKIIEQNGELDKLTNLLKKNTEEEKYYLSKQIYVHSKLMIIDDSFLILGSANINYRSMIPSGDSEICLSMYNPEKVKNFRKKLFNTHFKMDIENPNDDKFWENFYEIGRLNNDNFESKKDMKNNVDYYYIIFDKNIYNNGEIKFSEIEIGNKILGNFGKEYKIVGNIIPYQLFY
jgi:phosphatidylserine/phosphatidylglycerophosphate/cardiolipin synthase-like enzyme